MFIFPWNIFYILLAVGLFATIAILPYSLAMSPQALNQIKEKMAGKSSRLPPMVVVILASTLQGGLLIAVAAFVGLLATRAVGLGLPILQGILTGKPVLDQFLAFLPVSLVAGLGAGALIVILDYYVFRPRLPALFNEVSASISLWKGALACFYGGIVEEILLRLFAMSGLAWLIGLAWHTADGIPSLGAFWLANLLATLLFGAGHLPATKRIVPLTPLVIARALLLNGMAGLIFGFLFMTYGLEAAIVAHFSADVLMHLIAPAMKSIQQRSNIKLARPS